MTDPRSWLDLLAILAGLAGCMLFLASAIGLVRLPDVYTRVHAPTKAATLGLMCIAAASLLRHLAHRPLAGLEDLLLIVFVMLTVPVSSQLLLRAAALRNTPQDPRTRGEPPPGPDATDTLTVSTAEHGSEPGQKGDC